MSCYALRVSTLAVTIAAHVIPSEGGSRTGTTADIALEVQDAIETRKVPVESFDVAVPIVGFPASGFTFMHYRIDGPAVTLALEQGGGSQEITLTGRGLLFTAPVTALAARLPDAESLRADIELILAW